MDTVTYEQVTITVTESVTESIVYRQYGEIIAQHAVETFTIIGERIGRPGKNGEDGLPGAPGEPGPPGPNSIADFTTDDLAEGEENLYSPFQEIGTDLNFGDGAFRRLLTIFGVGERTFQAGVNGSVGSHFGARGAAGLCFPDGGDLLPITIASDGATALPSATVNLGRDGFRWGDVYAKTLDAIGTILGQGFMGVFKTSDRINWERIVLKWEGNRAVIGSDAAGSGSHRSVELRSYSGELYFNDGNSVARMTSGAWMFGNRFLYEVSGLHMIGNGFIEGKLVINGTTPLFNSNITVYQKTNERAFSLVAGVMKTSLSPRILYSMNSADETNPQVLDCVFIGANLLADREYILQTGESGVSNGGFLGLQCDGGTVGVGTHVKRSTLNVGGDVEIVESNKGLILTSPNGTRYRVTVNDAGALSTSVA